MLEQGFNALPERADNVARAVVDAAYHVHKALGPGLLEKVYEACFCHEMTKRGLSCNRQVCIPVVYDGVRFDEGLRIDVLIDDIVICELKSVEELAPVCHAQLLTYLKLTSKRLGFLINFNVPVIKEGIHRYVL